MSFFISVGFEGPGGQVDEHFENYSMIGFGRDGCSIVEAYLGYQMLIRSNELLFHKLPGFYNPGSFVN
jgi:hypothetical protein